MVNFDYNFKTINCFLIKGGGKKKTYNITLHIFKYKGILQHTKNIIIISISHTMNNHIILEKHPNKKE